MHHPGRTWAKIGIAAALLLLSRTASAEKTAPEILPASATAYVEVSRPGDLLALIDSRVGKEIRQSDAFAQAIASPKFREFRQALAAIEERSGMTWRPALEATTSGGLAAAFDMSTQGIVILAHPDDLKSADAVRDAFFSLARDDARSKGNPDPVEARTYRGMTTYRIADVTVANVGDWVMLSNKPALAKAVADTFLDGGKTLEADKQFREARELAGQVGPHPAAWGFVRLGTIRFLARLAHQPLLDPKYKSDNPVAEMILGGLLPVLRNTPYVTVAVSTQEHGPKLALASPNDPAWAEPQSKFYFAPPGEGAARPLTPRGTVLSLSTYRDVSAMWQSAPDLFTEDIAAKLAQADSSLSTIFGGRRFSSDVLSAIKPQIRFVVARQDYHSAGAAEPTVRLPGAALVLGIKPDQLAAVRRELRVGFQSVVAFANIDGGPKGRPLLEIQTEKRSGAEIQYATYEAPDAGGAAKSGKPAAPTADMYLNFSPALALSEKYIILSSTRQLAEELADLASRQDDKDAATDQNTVIKIDARPAAELIRENREQLVAQNMLEKGHDRAQAEKQIDLLRTIVEAFRDASLRLVPAEKSIRLELQVRSTDQDRVSP
jgi:hypothetical protein